MELSRALMEFAYAAGRWRGAWRFASADLRKAASFATVSASWEVFRRDAGRGDVGREHAPIGETDLLSTIDPRRDGVLLWLADRGVTGIAEAATVLARATDGRQALRVDARTLLEVALERVGTPPAPKGPMARMLSGMIAPDNVELAPLISLAAVVDRLRDDPAFLEGAGDQVQHLLPQGTITHYAPAEAGATWAMNLALMARVSTIGIVMVPGLVSRALFRAHTEPDETASTLAEGGARALSASCDRLERIGQEMERGKAALAHLSRNARAGDAWMLLASTGALSRRQLARALGLSRAGADIQARILSEAGLCTLGGGGRIAWAAPRPAENSSTSGALDWRLSGAVADLDASMADLDRLLANSNIGLASGDQGKV